jgi:hypothetical protein
LGSNEEALVMGETWGEVARHEVAKRECLYFDDVLAEIRHRIPADALPLAAVTCAEHLLARHLAVPPGDQRPFTAGWRGPISSLWRALANPQGADRISVEGALRAFRESDLNHSDGQDGPDDADDAAAAACAYAAEAHLERNGTSAFSAVSRVVDEAFARVDVQKADAQPAVPSDSEFIDDCCHPIVQSELRWLLALASLLAANPLESATVARARRHALDGLADFGTSEAGR